MIDEREVQELREQLNQQNLRLHGVERKFPVWAQNRGVSRERHMHQLEKHMGGENLHTHDAMLFAQGTYTGDGTASKAITGLGFTPKVVVTKANDNTINDANAVFRTSNMTTSRTITSAADSLDGVLSFNADGFTVKHEAAATQGKTNVSGKTYYWYAFGGDRVVVGNYTGNGVNGKAVVGIGFAPQMVWIQIRGTGSGTIHRTKSMGTEDYSFASDLGSTDRILTLDADGFTLGTNTDVNANAGVYDYIAWGLAENFDEGTYTGDGVDNRNLPSPPLLFNPLLVHIKPDAGHPPHFKTGTLTGDNSMDYSATLSEANNIQSLSAAQGTFQVGTDITGVNANGVTYYYFAVGSASGTASLIVEEDGVIVDANTSVLDFTEPDGTLVTSSPAGEANVNMALYAKLAGRAGGQTLIGGTATGEFLNFRGNSVDAAAISRFLQTSASPSTDMVRGVTTGETGTSTGATTGPPGTMTDTTKTWATSQWVGAVVTSGGKTMTVTSNTSTVLTGTAGWSGGGNPGVAAYSISLAEGFPRWAIGFDAAAQPRLLLGSGFVAPAIEVARGGTNVLNLRFLTAATSAITLRSLASTDTQPRFEVTGGNTGRIAWGSGGSASVDTALARIIANVVKVGIGTTPGSQPGLELPGPTTPGHIVAPVSLGNRIYSAIFANRTRLFCINDNGIIAGPIGYPEGVLGNVPLCGLGAFGVDANNLVTTPWGCLGGVNHVFNTRSTARTETGFTQLRLTTNATAGTVAGSIASRAGLDWPIHTELNGSPMLQVRFAIDSNANIRLFIGWTNLTLSQMVWKDEPGDAGTADAAVTYTATTMTDTREAWTVNEWVGAILLNEPFTTSLVVTSNTATTITGTAGWTNGTPAAGSAWSLGQYLGLQYSSGRGDTTWQFVAKEATNTFTRVDTLIGVTGSLTSASIVRITHDTAGSAGAVCELFGPDRVSLGAAVSMIASLAPGAANDMRTVAAIETRTGATKTIGLEAGQEVIRGAL